MTPAPTLPQHLLDVRKIYLEPEVEGYERGREILARFPAAERVPVASH
jgi:spore photoproduct lyase